MDLPKMGWLPQALATKQLSSVIRKRKNPQR
jgi:hypothetical protein